MTFISHAQNFEDVRLWRAFSDIKEGRYLDIGTQGPVRDSVSLAFYERGWRGVHVEPTPAYAAAMRLARPDETVIEAAVSKAPGPIQLFEIPETGLSTGVAEIAQRHRAAGWEHQVITVPTVTLAGLFDLMGAAPIHWLKIDVEGMEADVLESWGNHPARPIALVIEATAPNTQIKTHEAWYDSILSRGYRDVLFDGLSRYFIHEKHAERGAALALSPNVFDSFHVESTHFSAGGIAAENSATIDAVRQHAEVDRIETLASALAQAEVEHRDHVAALRQQAEAERTDALNAALAQAEARRLAEIAELQKHAEINRKETLASALAQAEVEHRDHVAALRQQAEAERTDALTAELAQAEARRLAEIAELQKYAEINRKETLAAALAQAEARHRDHVAALRQQAEMELAEALNAEVVKASAVLDATRTALEAQIAASAKALLEMQQSLAARQQESRVLAREAGRLEGTLAAQADAIAVRVRDAEAARRDLVMRLTRSEHALEDSRIRVSDLREKVQALSGEHALSLMGANASLEATEVRAARLSEHLAGIKQHLLESKAGRELAEQQRDEALRENAAQAAAHAAELERLHAHIAMADRHLSESKAGRELAEQQRDEALRERIAQTAYHAAELERLKAHIATNSLLFGESEAARELAERQRDEALQERTAQAASHPAEIKRLNDHIAWREGQLAQVLRLLNLEPDPLAGWPRRVATLLARAVGRRSEGIAAAHAAEMQAWRASLALTPDLALDRTAFSFAVERHMPDLDRVWKDLDMSIGQGSVTSVPQLLALHDVEFIRTAYEVVLGRAPDPEGGAYYRNRLRSGVHKLEILSQLRRSPEGRLFTPGVAGFDRAVRQYRLSNLPLLGPLLAIFIRGERNTRTAVALRRMEQAVMAELTGRVQASALPGELKSALEWMDARIGRVIEIAEELQPRVEEMRSALERIETNVEQRIASGDVPIGEGNLTQGNRSMLARKSHGSIAMAAFVDQSCCRGIGAYRV